MNILLTAITFILMLMILVVIHELGHFWAARRAGVKVEEFGVGLPPKLWGRKRGETEYTVNLLPIGGFVRMHGELPDGVSVKEGPKVEAQQAEMDNKRSFIHKSVGWRAIILSAGVVANLLLAMVLFTIVYTVGFDQGVPSGRIEQVATDSPAEAAGLAEGQTIVSMDGVPFDEVEPAFAAAINQKRGQEVTLMVRAEDGSEQEVVVRPRVEIPAGQGALGVNLGVDVETVRYPVWTAWWEGSKQAVQFSWMIVTSLTGMIGDLVAHGDTPQDLAGPVGIASMVGEARQAGIVPLLFFAGIISVNLAVINLLPFPALDGGRLVFVAVEAITRRRVSPKVEAITHTVGMALLLGLIALITISDIGKMF